jgi:DNA-directed RNA polymerase subunit K
MRSAEVIMLERLTRFETARIIGARALQIAYGAPIMIDLPKSAKNPLSPTEIAKIELEKGAIPISVKRKH